MTLNREPGWAVPHILQLRGMFQTEEGAVRRRETTEWQPEARTSRAVMWRLSLIDDELRLCFAAIRTAITDGKLDDDDGDSEDPVCVPVKAGSSNSSSDGDDEKKDLIRQAGGLWKVARPGRKSWRCRMGGGATRSTPSTSTRMGNFLDGWEGQMAAHCLPLS
ncbi:hypothetical protein MAPG_08676 [Magnaporthiopsis poae ATCC 64411]|uniref:Uncharacterized protein n=1 Tax=Magnaporthiopsis poae (strain ATCC 64411 / 73-15) TaxID=644358 RepID=A0A0C4E7Z3_MAGP6|nr:hypothetical protein MAPG_08676 [Magnaporthiopsis poae ATCC 64411]